MIDKVKKLLLAAVASAALIATSEAAQSLNITNYLVAGANGSFTGYPTNVANSTNGIFAGTGVGIDISKYDNVGLCFQGMLWNTNASTYTLGIALVTALSQSTPLVLTNQTDWNTILNPALQFTVTIPASSTNVAINWQTNLASAGQIGNGPMWIGAYYVTNNMANNAYITNATLLIGKKILPKIDVGL